MEYKDLNQIGNVRGITPAVKYLLFLNIAIFLLERWFGVPLERIFALPSEWFSTGQFWQLFTYMFVHGSFSHIFMNMLMLYFIGPTVERTLGSYRFFILYYLSGVIGGIGWALLASHSYCVGASGAIMGILGAFGAFYPNSTVYLWFVIPIKTAWLVAGMIAWELFETIAGSSGGVANAAHLAGAIAGFSYAFTLKNSNRIQDFEARFRKLFSSASSSSFSSKKKNDLPTTDEMDAILDKIGKQGIGALTDRERELLRKATQR